MEENRAGMGTTLGGDVKTPNVKSEPRDNWAHRSKGMRCSTCMWYVGKKKLVGRCRRRCPTMNGWPVMFETDWCGDHKLDEEKI